MTDRELMQQALEALKFGLHVGFDESSESQIKKGSQAFHQHSNAITALRERLARQEQPDMRHPKVQAIIGARARLQIELGLVEQLLDDPDFETTPLDMEYWGPMHDRLKDALTLPARQEPFGYLWPTGVHPEFRFTKQKRDGVEGMPLYTAPQPREWVGLDHDDIHALVNEYFYEGMQPSAIHFANFARAIESKLKEKNA